MNTRVKMKRIGLSIAVIFLAFSFSGCVEATGQKSVMIGAPTQLRLVIVQNGFKLSWQLSPEDQRTVTGYEIVRSDLASGPFITVATVKSGVSEYIDDTASTEIIYYYKVRAFAGKSSSPYSNTVTGER